MAAWVAGWLPAWVGGWLALHAPSQPLATLSGARGAAAVELLVRSSYRAVQLYCRSTYSCLSRYAGWLARAVRSAQPASVSTARTLYAWKQRDAPVAHDRRRLPVGLPYRLPREIGTYSGQATIYPLDKSEIAKRKP